MNEYNADDEIIELTSEENYQNVVNNIRKKSLFR